MSRNRELRLHQRNDEPLHRLTDRLRAGTCGEAPHRSWVSDGLVCKNAETSTTGDTVMGRRGPDQVVSDTSGLDGCDG